MGEQIIEFETAKTAKEKGIEVECLHFYAKPKCKVFGIDEEGRPYKSVNRKGVVLMVGESAVLSEENVYYAPTQSHLQTVLRNAHKIYVIPSPIENAWECKVHIPDSNGFVFNSGSTSFRVNKEFPDFSRDDAYHFETYEEALNYVNNEK